MSARRTPQPVPDAFSRYHASKAAAPRTRRLNRDSTSNSRRQELRRRPGSPSNRTSPPSSTNSSPIILLSVGLEQRLFAAHETILSASPFFASQLQPHNQNHNNKTQNTNIPIITQHHPTQQLPSRRIDLPDEQPEVLSCVLEYLYKGDYYPRLQHNPHDRTWRLEDSAGSEDDGGGRGCCATVFHHLAGTTILRDTAVYCAAEKYNLPTLQRLSLRKQGLHSGIPCTTILASARFAYAHTPDTESRLRAHYLALIIRCRNTFKSSGTMQAEMERGGKLFFDLFVALCNHMDDLRPGTAASVHSSTTTTR